MNKNRLRQITLWVIAADFPVLYLGVVTLENMLMTIVALAVMSIVVGVVTLVY